MLDDFVDELSRGFQGRSYVVVVTLRIAMAAIVGGVVGFERSWTGKQAGMRTHMLVCLGAAIFVMTISVEGGVDPNALSRVIQGTATGIGFVGAGTILKLSDRGKVKGLTTAANIWLTAALGTAIGTGHYYLSTAGVIAAWTTLVIVERLEERVQAHSLRRHRHQHQHQSDEIIPHD